MNTFNKSIFAKRLHYYMEQKGVDRRQLCDDLNLKYSTVSEWLSANKYPRIDKIELLANYFGITKSNLIEDDKPADTLTILPQNKIHMIPVFGSVAAGFGAYASSDIIEYIPLYIENDSDVEDTICITVKGQSMYPKIEEGDRIVVRRQDSVDSGRIAVVMIGEDAVVKRVEIERNKLTLISINPEYPPRVIEGKDLEDVRIVGLVQEVMKKV